MFHRLKFRYQLDILVLLALLLFILFSGLYYFSFSNILYTHAEDRAEQMIEQVAQNVENMSGSVRSSANGLIYYSTLVQELMTSDDRLENYERYNSLEQLVNAAKAANSSIYSVSWLSNDGRMITDPGRDDYDIVSRLLEKYDFSSDDFQKPVFTSLVPGDSAGFYYFGYVFPVYSRMTPGLPRVGSGIFVLNIWELENLVKVNNITENSLFAILDQENHVIVSNRDLKTGDVYQDIFWNEESAELVSATIEYKGMESIAQCMHVPETGWKIVSIIPRNELARDMDTVLRVGLTLIVIGSLVMLALGHVIIMNVTDPIQTIVDFLRSERKNPLNHRIKIKQQNELAIISDSINTMLDRVEDMTKEIVDHQSLLYEAKLAEQEAELAALQSQINPHFLYNTLNCLSNIGLAYDVPEVSDISVAMSNIYRYSIKGDNMVRLESELQCIKEYMRIMDIRFNGKFETEYRFDDEVLQLYTLRMILQPLVENAVYHGMEMRSQKGKLLLEGKIQGETLVISVANNGKGMSEETLRKLRETIANYENASLVNAEKSSIGLSNINKRIKLQFGRQYGLQVESEETTGTCVTLTLPIIRDR